AIGHPDLPPLCLGRLVVEQALAFALAGSFFPVLNQGASFQNFFDAIRSILLSRLDVEHIPLAQPKIEGMVSGIPIAGSGRIRSLSLREHRRQNKTQRECQWEL